jgi:hypothetical protein
MLSVECFQLDMKLFLTTLPRNFIGCFAGRRLVWHVVAILLTVILVMGGFDWRYFLATRDPALRQWLWPAVVIGMFLPVILPLALIATGTIARNARITVAGWAIGQAALLGYLVSIAYKAFTGRAHPSHAAGADKQPAYFQAEQRWRRQGAVEALWGDLHDDDIKTLNLPRVVRQATSAPVEFRNSSVASVPFSGCVNPSHKCERFNSSPIPPNPALMLCASDLAKGQARACPQNA